MTKLNSRQATQGACGQVWPGICTGALRRCVADPGLMWTAEGFCTIFSGRGRGPVAGFVGIVDGRIFRYDTGIDRRNLRTGLPYRRSNINYQRDRLVEDHALDRGRHALRLNAVPYYREHYKSHARLITGMAPGPGRVCVRHRVYDD